MSILINGMEMPTNENAVILITPSGDVWMIGDMPNEDTHLVKAKAVPVPPRGDLIDRREAIIDANERAYDFWLSDNEVNATIQFLKEQPTIIPAEEGET